MSSNTSLVFDRRAVGLISQFIGGICAHPFNIHVWDAFDLQLTSLFNWLQPSEALTHYNTPATFVMTDPISFGSSYGSNYITLNELTDNIAIVIRIPRLCGDVGKAHRRVGMETVGEKLHSRPFKDLIHFCD
jgi:hypothetical protein